MGRWNEARIWNLWLNRNNLIFREGGQEVDNVFTARVFRAKEMDTIWRNGNLIGKEGNKYIYEERQICWIFLEMVTLGVYLE